MAQRKKYSSNAERQAAYRKRHTWPREGQKAEAEKHLRALSDALRMKGRYT